MSAQLLQQNHDVRTKRMIIYPLELIIQNQQAFRECLAKYYLIAS